MIQTNEKNELSISTTPSHSSITSANLLATLSSLTQAFKEYLESSKIESNSFNDSENKGNIIEAYIKTITAFIEQSQETTLQGLNRSLKGASEYLCRSLKDEEIIPRGKSSLTIKAVNDIMINMMNKHNSKSISQDFALIKRSLVDLSKDLLLLSNVAKQKISNFFIWSLRSGMVILVHGYSTTIIYSLIESKKKGINLTVYVTESRPENAGENMVKILTEQGIESRLILDSSVGYHMKDVDCVLVGADAVCENGGIINRIGTFTLAICAKNFKKPFYVLVESLKFLKMYPLDQSDIPESVNTYKNERNIDCYFNYCDYTDPEFITLLFTDIGIFTPSAVSDELIQMFYN